jgi:hypothetical protein
MKGSEGRIGASTCDRLLDFLARQPKPQILSN